MKKELLLIGLAVFLTGCETKVVLKVKEEDQILEYGSRIDVNASTYLSNDEEVLKDVKIEGIPENEKNKDYPAIGEYSLQFIYKENVDDAVEKKVSIKDTTAPLFLDVKDAYTVDYSKKLSLDLFKATDLSKVTITLDDKNVNYNKAGKYKATIIAKDESNNETKKEIEVIVKEEVKKASTTTSSFNKPSSTTSSKKNTSAENMPSSNSSTSSKKENYEYDIGNSGMLFDTEDEAISYGNQYMMDHIETIQGYGYWSTYDKWTIHFRYYD